MWFPSLLGKYNGCWFSVAQSHTLLWTEGKMQAITMFVSDLFCICIKDAKRPNDAQTDNSKKVLKTFEKICRYMMLYLTLKDCCEWGNSAIFWGLLEFARSSLSHISLLEEPTQKSFPTLNLSLLCRVLIQTRFQHSTYVYNIMWLLNKNYITSRILPST